ncbi:MAG: hypothetical protein Q9174_006417, partial [Haloplaca sp. 1 TL-2023]
MSRICSRGRRAVLMLLMTCLSFYVGTGQTEQHEADDYAESDNYHILYCRANSTNSPAAHLQRLLPKMIWGLHTVLADLAKGTSSAHGYETFFKTQENVEKVHDVFWSMITAPDIYSSSGGENPWYMYTPPTFVCAIDGEPVTRRLQQECRSPQPKVMFVDEGRGFVTVCPHFWSLPHVPQKDKCPIVVNNQFQNNGQVFANTQLAIMIHELVHIYSPHNARVREVYDIREAASLNATASLQNAQSYAYYAA